MQSLPSFSSGFESDRGAPGQDTQSTFQIPDASSVRREVTEAREELQKFVTQYAVDRANLIHHAAAARTVKRVLRAGDVQVAKQIVSWCQRHGQSLPETLKIILPIARQAFDATKSACRIAEDREFSEALKAIEHEMFELGLTVGKARGSSDYSETANEIRRTIRDRQVELCERDHPSLFKRYPFLLERLASVVELGEIQGEQKYLASRRVALRIHGHILREKFDLIQDELSKLPIDERVLVNEVYTEAFSHSLREGVVHAFAELRSRREALTIRVTKPSTYKNFIPITTQSLGTIRRCLRLGSSLRTALEDRYGAEAGLVTVGLMRLRSTLGALNPVGKQGVREIVGGGWSELRDLRHDIRKSFSAFIKLERDRLEAGGKLSSKDALSPLMATKLFAKSLLRLDEVIIAQFEKSEKAKIERLLSDDAISAAADSLEASLAQVEGKLLRRVNRLLGIPGKAETILGILKGLSEQELRTLDERFGELHGQRWAAATLHDALASNLSGALRTECLAILESDEHTAAAARLYAALRRNRKSLISALAAETELDSSTLKGVGARYRELYADDKKAIKKFRNLPSVYKEWMNCLLEGDRLGAGAARMEAALYWKSEEWVGESFYAHGHAMNTELIRAFESRPAPRRRLSLRDRQVGRCFFQELRRKEGAAEVDILRSLMSRGTLSEAEQMRHCMLGRTKNVQGILSLLTGKDREAQDELAQAYAERFQQRRISPRRMMCAARAFLREFNVLSPTASVSYLRALVAADRELLVPRDLDRDLARTLCGHKRFDAAILRLGMPASPKEILERLEQRIEHEQSGWLSRLFDSSAPGQRASQAIAKLRADFHTRFALGSESNDDRRQFLVDVRAVEHDLQELRELKERRGLLVANVCSASLVVGSAVSLGASLTNYLVVAPTVFGVSFSCRVLTKSLIKGRGYGRRELRLDGYLAAVDGAICGIGGILKTVQGMYLAKSLISSRGLLLFGVTSLAKGQMKVRLHRVGLGAFARRYRELGTGHALRIKQLEEERTERLLGKRMTQAIKEFHEELPGYALEGEFMRAVALKALRMQRNGRLNDFDKRPDQ